MNKKDTLKKNKRIAKIGLPILAIIIGLLVWKIGFDFFGYAIALLIVGAIIIAVLQGRCELSGTPTNYPSKKQERIANGTATISDGVNWRTGKQYVPGVGYRDPQGNYYNHNGVPTVPTVKVDKKDNK